MVVTRSRLCLLEIPALGATPLSLLLHISSGQSPPSPCLSFLIVLPTSELCVL